MNLRHLELFYFTARAGGISAAIGTLRQPIRQPALSAQLQTLEADLGVRLFHRRPFFLTPAGEELFDYIEPFFQGLPDVCQRLAETEEHSLRIVAGPSTFSTHIPEVLRQLKTEEPKLNLRLQESPGSEAILECMRNQEADLAICAMQLEQADSLTGFTCRKLTEIPLGLLVPGSCPYKSLEGIPRSDDGMLTEPLISLPRAEIAASLFQQGLRDLGLIWRPSIEVTDFGTVAAYTLGGFGIGITTRIPGQALPDGLRLVDLPPAFPRLAIFVIVNKQTTPPSKRFVELLEKKARDVFS